MSAEPAAVSDAPERLTWDQVRERYPDQWVMLVDIDNVNETDFEFRSALVIGHGPGRKDVFARVGPLLDRYTSFACLFTGRVRAPVRSYLAP